MPRRREGSGDSFWVSYSDLATGLMIVFMVVTLIMVALVVESSETQKESVQKIVIQLRVILNTRAQLADSIRQAFGDESGVDADPITAQLDVDDQKIRFEFGKADLQDDGKGFLREFTPRYLCAIWHHEQTVGTPPACRFEAGEDCPRLDPEKPGGVRQIRVSGHADRYGAEYSRNHSLSAERAETVVQYMVRVLECAAGEPAANCWERIEDQPLSAIKLAAECRGHEAEVLTYAQERLWAVGTGDSEHCQKLLTANGWDTCYADGQDRESADERKVTFGLQVTGDDMTGLLQHVERLQRTVGLDDDAPQGLGLAHMTNVAAQACWDDMSAYHGCDELLRGCLAEEPLNLPGHCTALRERRLEPQLNSGVQLICVDEPTLPGCRTAPQ